MNQHLQPILNFIQQNKILTNEEKDPLINSLKDANAELDEKSKAIVAKNRELEIESSIEKVRNVAMKMREPSNMLDVCKTISNELELLSVKEIRNVQTAIFYAEKGTYMNYEYYSKHDQTVITETTYKNNELHNTFALQMMKGGSEFFATHMNGDEVKNWIAYQKTTNVFIDHYLYTASSLNYYWYSLGTVALGMSTYEPLIEEHQLLFRRFVKVFELAYLRYLDIEKAEAQVKEAHIQLALEKVRARTMAMQRSDELQDAAILLFQQMKALDVQTGSCGFNIWEKDEKASIVWMSSAEGVLQAPFKMPHTTNTTYKQVYAAMKHGQTFFVKEVGGKALDKHFGYLLNLPGIGDVIKHLRETGYVFPKKMVFHFAFFNNGYLSFHLHEAYPEAHDIFKRFAKVFEQTYTRFLDLQKAEAQSKEAQIEAALERVRSRSMGMQKSEELKEVIQVVYEQFVVLNIHVQHTDFIMDYKERDDMLIWLADKHAVPFQITIPYFDCAHWNSYKEAKSTGKNFFANQLSFEEKNKFYEDLFMLYPVPEEAKNYYFSAAGLAISTVLLDDVGLYIENFEGTPYSDEDNKTLMRFGKVFQQTYTRFLDLQKAEAQSKEAKIQLALERVRARTMAMQKSDELSETASIIFQQFKLLGETPAQLTIGVFNEEDRFIELRITDVLGTGAKIDQSYKISIDEPTLINKLYQAWKQEKKSTVIELTGKELIDWITYRNTLDSRDDYKTSINKHEHWFVCAGFFSKGMISFSKNDPIREETIQIMERFAGVFDLTYTRFLDLKKAEAQVREAKIEAALEKVRSKALAMQKPDELMEVAKMLRNEMNLLGVEELETSSIYIHNEATGKTECWYAIKDEHHTENRLVSDYMFIDLNETFIGKQMLAFYLSDAKQISIKMQGENRKEWINYCEKHSKVLNGFYGDKIPDRTYHLYKFSNGYIGAASQGDISEESWDLLQRTTSVFSLAYTRFNDLLHAEAQAREAQIELALERVRARTMAMQKSNELQEVVNNVYERLNELKVEMDGAAICSFIEGSKDYFVWIGDYPEPLRINFNDLTQVQKDYNEVIDRREELFTKTYSAETKKEYIQFLLKQTVLGVTMPEEQKLLLLASDFFTTSLACTKNTVFQLYRYTERPFSKEENEILKRFAKVFEQTYTRFLDLKKAEMQAQEAQIETSLERVRAQAMAMRTPQDLTDICKVLYTELHNLGFSGIRNAMINIHDDDKGSFVNYDYSDEIGKSINHLRYNIHLVIEKQIRQMRSAGDAFSETYFKGKDLEDWKAFRKSVGERDARRIENMDALYYYFYSIGTGSIGISTFSVVVEEKLEVLKRFRNVFNLSYQRYTDIALAEAQAREAHIEAALERVRSRTLAMQKSDELAETAAVLFKQLIILGIEPNRLYISIMKDDEGKTEFWITDEDGSKVSMAYEDNLNNNGSFKKMFDGWIQQKKSLVIDMKGEELDHYFQHLSSINVPFKGGLTQKRRLQYIAYFNKGFIGMASPDEQPEDTLQLLERFAYVFNLTFTRFNDLQMAEAHALQARHDLIEIKEARKKAEETLAELQATQKQLIQSEKMASLGELTAGIAHEIQNPLNFVNNFSEVNKEMIVEMKDNIDNGNFDEVKNIANDIEANEEKINYHGKRADAIVKGMLQHSRQTTNVKEPIDINSLCDEYLRLSFHGLRAKDKKFNVDIKTDFDKSIGTINIVAQDIGRVLLNLYTNAFYATSEKAKNGYMYDPMVTVSTKKENDKIVIEVADNGSGISPKVIDKIFQPFFTTKPSGQGTGLGLSLSYDIIKANGGEINVVTKEGDGSTFIIHLPNL